MHEKMACAVRALLNVYFLRLHRLRPRRPNPFYSQFEGVYRGRYAIDHFIIDFMRCAEYFNDVETGLYNVYFLLRSRRRPNP